MLMKKSFTPLKSLFGQIIKSQLQTFSVIALLLLFAIAANAENPTTTNTHLGGKFNKSKVSNSTNPSDATLDSLQIADAATGLPGTISPAFNPAVTTYAATTPYASPDIVVVADIADSAATITINGSNLPLQKQNGIWTGFRLLPVSAGQSTLLTIVVTSADKSVTKTYTVNVTQAPPLTKLSSLSLSQLCRYCNNYIPLDQTFSTDVFSYTATAQYAQSVAYVDALPTEVRPIGDIVTINGQPATISNGGYDGAPGTAQLTVPLNVGKNTITVVVTAPDSSTSHTYTITVTRLVPPSNDNLSTLTLLAGNQPVYSVLSPNPILSISPSFDPSITSYSTTVAPGMSQVSLFPTPSDYNNATMVVNGITLSNINPNEVGGEFPRFTYPNLNPINLNVGTNVISMVVTAADQVTTKTYTLTITRPLPAVKPTVQANHVFFSSITTNSATASWTNGNGSSRAAFIFMGANGSPLPVDSTAYYPVPSYGSGDPVGSTGWYCIYNGTGSSVNVTGLSAGATYRVAVVEYNSTPASSEYIPIDNRYLTTRIAPANVTTTQIYPTTPAQKMLFTNTTATTTTASWTNGNGSARAVFIFMGANGSPLPVDNTNYVAKTTFAAGTQVGTSGWYCVYNGTGSSVNISGLTGGVTYRVCAVEYNGASGAEDYLLTRESPASVVTPITYPTAQAQKMLFTNTTATTTTASWTNGNGAARAVFIFLGANGSPLPLDNTNYTANTTFAAGTEVGTSGWYCVYNGTGSSVNISGLTGGVTYRVCAVEYNGASGAEDYLLTRESPSSVTTLTAYPTVPALKMLFTNTTPTTTTASWTNGNGTARAVFIFMGANGSSLPFDNITYNAEPVYAAGTQIGASGWYCIYNGTGSSVDISGLTAGATYRVTAVEYDGGAGSEKYLTTRQAPSNVYLPTIRTITLFRTFSDTTSSENSNVTANNILSPNGDGVNDTWIVKNIEQYPNNKVTVYDKKGTIVFSKKGYTNDWSGTFRGATLNEDTYYYLVDLGNGSVIKGFMTVVRDR